MASYAIIKETDLLNESYVCFVNKCLKRGVKEYEVADLDINERHGEVYVFCDDHASDDFAIEFHLGNVEAMRQDYFDTKAKEAANDERVHREIFRGLGGLS